MSTTRWSIPPLLNQLLPLTKFPAEMQAAAAAAVAAHHNAYAPYSNFAVGAALLHPNDVVTAGCNYENCTLQSCCAERCAIVKANVEGRRCARAVAVYGRPVAAEQSTTASPPPGDGLCPPCGLCRQLLVEVADLSQNFEDFIVMLVSRDASKAKLLRLADLVPMKFGPGDIGMDVCRLANARHDE